MKAKQPRAEYLKLARIADYTAELARRLADPSADAADPNTIRNLKRSMKREQEQLETIMRYLNRTPSKPERPSYTEVESVVCGVTVARCVKIGEGPFAPDQVFQPNKQLDALETRRAIGDAFLNREGHEDPDWLGSALCDLNLCRMESDFQSWAEENRFEDVERLFEYITKGRKVV